MKGLAIAASLALLLSAAPVFAQGAAGQQPPPPKPATQQPPPAQQPPPKPALPVQPVVPAPTPVAPAAPFPAGAKLAVVNLQAIASNSTEGKALAARVQTLMQKKQNEGAERSKQLQANQQKLQQSGSLMNDQARAALEKEIERQQVDGQRFQQDAQAEVNELTQELQGEFQKRLFPLLQQLAQEKQLQVLLSVQDAGVIWAEPGIDLTAEAIKKLDGSAKPGAPK
ncbi:MAG TPA: OmpH family outer membrane protein [Vicinamibacterales bacterium]|jgi:outer membrane protein